MRASSFISFFLFVGSSNTKQLNQEVNHLKIQLAGLLESKIYDIEANQTIKNLHVTMEDVQEQAEWHLIVASGEPYHEARKTEAFKWLNEDNSTCHLRDPDFALQFQEAIPVMIRDEQYLCQGGTNPTHCVNLLTGNSEFLGFFLLKGSFASTVTTNNEVFVFGRDGSYETITLTIDLAQNDLDWLVDRAEARPEGVVPFSWHSGCSTLINSTTILLAGGIQNGTITSKTWLFNFKTEEWTQGPNMIEERTNLGCGLIKSINSVAAFGSTRITEIVKLPGGSFKQVDDFPFNLGGMSTLQDPTDDSSLVVIGGHDKINGKTSDAILKLTCTAEEDCKWQVLNHKLQFPRWGHVAFFTNKPVNCTQIS